METWTTPDADIFSVALETKGNADAGDDFASEVSGAVG